MLGRATLGTSSPLIRSGVLSPPARGSWNAPAVGRHIEPGAAGATAAAAVCATAGVAAAATVAATTAAAGDTADDKKKAAPNTTPGLGAPKTA